MLIVFVVCWRWMLKDICWACLLMLELFVDIVCWSCLLELFVEVVRCCWLLELFVEFVCWCWLLELFVEVVCWCWLLELSVEVVCWSACWFQPPFHWNHHSYPFPKRFNAFRIWFPIDWYHKRLHHACTSLTITLPSHLYTWPLPLPFPLPRMQPWVFFIFQVYSPPSPVYDVSVDVPTVFMTIKPHTVLPVPLSEGTNPGDLHLTFIKCPHIYTSNALCRTWTLGR